MNSADAHRTVAAIDHVQDELRSVDARARESGAEERARAIGTGCLATLLAASALLIALPSGVSALQSVVVQEVFAIGGEGNGAGIELGLPRAVAIDEQTVWIADEGSFRVVVVDRESQRVQSVGRRGSGPEEFLSLTDLALLAPNRAAILDPMNGRIGVVEVALDAVRIVRTVRLGSIVSPEALCSRAGNIVVLGSRAGNLLHVIDSNGEVVRSFGEPFLAAEPVIGSNLNLGKRGRLACTDSPDDGPSIVAVSREFGIVHAYTPDGTLMWKRALPAFRPMEIGPTPDGRGVVYRTPREGSYHIAVSVSFADGAQQLLIQVAEVTSGTRHPDEASRTVSHWLSPRDGSLVMTTSELPRLNAVGSDGRLGGGIDNSLVPVVRVYEIRARREQN
jgi:hypothetical protein